MPIITSFKACTDLEEPPNFSDGTWKFDEVEKGSLLRKPKQLGQ